MFRRRFRMSRSLFLRIYDAIQRHDNYFVQRRDRVGKLGLSGLQKMTAAFRMLAYGVPADSTDEYIKIGESTALESLKRFCRAIVEVFACRYLRSPDANDVARLLHIGESRGFPRMLGSLDCMHWKWKNCPTAWGGQYAGRSRSPTIILEAVADYDLWIWHAYFGLPGSNNDINVLEASHLFANLAEGTAPPASYVINEKPYNMSYYLADGIYPKWSTLVQTIHDPRGPKKKLFAMKQEACRKDVERAFGVLQSRFAIVAGPSRLWNKTVLHDIMTSCIIMHNMIIEDERDIDAPIEERVEVPIEEVEMTGETTIDVIKRCSSSLYKNFSPIDTMLDWPPENPFEHSKLLNYYELQEDNDWIRLYLELAVATTNRGTIRDLDDLSNLKIIQVAIDTTPQDVDLVFNRTYFAIVYIQYKDSCEARVGKDVDRVAIVRRAFDEQRGCFSLVGKTLRLPKE
ncbi:F21J9.3 [Arabidopsis thaliana]|uniref:F21J9.3 n=2 Tax=Arabidopsis thaliana TaxID=3702 RepID=Q9FYM5_ARATH|nr:F21J9.3 [Arabidopsis thaliana]